MNNINIQRGNQHNLTKILN